MSEVKIIEVGEIGNYYGGLDIRNNNGVFEWSIQDWNGHVWREISEPLYNQLILHNEAIGKKKPNE